MRTEASIAAADVVVLMLDASQGPTAHDKHIASLILNHHRGCVVVVNKWDNLDDYQRDRIKKELERRMIFLSFARFHFISALRGSGIGPVLKSVDEAYRAAMAKLPTPKLTQVLHDAVTRHAPPKSGFFRPKPKYAHQGGSNPPIIVIHGNHLEAVNNSYKRYLENTFRESFQLMGTPLKVEFKANVNPYEGKKAAPLTERELKKVHRDHRRRRRMFG